ncbi:uncharacterized protein LOC142545183 [Primulina tabacum]|uniref:uncharacterized protein LOC142545183 n=1 Tax=Primulina tabacum TaxID=48773 RepID=UPI003F596ACD
MDKSIVPVEESHRKSDSAASAAKSIGSLVQINSIAIDLSSAAEEIESPAHEHFSIRGFVSEMRKKDLKTCSLFASECNPSDNLPMLYVPKFRWWHCSNCIPEIATERTTLDMVLADRSLAGTSSCKNVDGGDGLFLYNRKKTGNKNGPRDYGSYHADNNTRDNIMNSNPPRAEGHKTCSKDKTDVRIKEGGNLCANIAEADPLHVQEIDAHSADAYDEPFNSASGSNGAFSFVPHRRKPKLRSLADIMEEETNLIIEHQRTRSASSNGIQVTSTGMEAILAPMPDILSGISKGTRSPPRKRKMALEEDIEPLEMKYSKGTTKRFRGLMLDGGKIHSRVETSDSESGGDASTRSSFQLASKAQRIKAKKGKALYMNKKTRPVVIDNGSVKLQEVPKTYAANSENSLKDTVAETSIYKQGHVPSTFVDVGPYVRSFLPAQLMDMISDPSNSKSPEIEADHNPFTPSGKNILGECNNKAKVGLDLSLNSFIDSERNSNNQYSFRQHRGIPDLNESFGQKTDMMQGKQLQNLFEERSLLPHNTLDVSISLNKETATEGKRPLGVYESSTVQSVYKNIELRGASDEMEIIELLAKNKRDRELGNLRKHVTSVGINSSIRRSSALYADGCHRMINFPPGNARTGVPVASGNICVGQSIPVSFPRLNQYQMDMSKLNESQFKLITPFTPTQQRKPRYLTSSSIIAGPRPREVPDLLWPPRCENVPFHHIPPNSMGMYSFSDQCHKGKTISDIKGGEGRIGTSPKSVGSLDPYSNDAIPAMQLLSLMDQGIASGSSIKVSQKHFPDKPFSPCNHHPRVNWNENQMFLGGSIFSQNNQKTLHHGVYCPGESSKKASSYIQVGQVRSEPKNSNTVFSGRPSDHVTQPSKNNPALSICILNKNPADFSIPDSSNKYTISAKDLKRRNMNASKEKSRTVNLENKKRARVRKNGFAKENSKK